MGVPLGEAFSDVLALGRDVADVGAVAMALRTIVIYMVSLALVRLGSKRLLSDASAFDFIVAIMLGSVMSRAINGSAPFFPTLVSGAVLVGLHWLFAKLAYSTNWFGSIVKGEPTVLIRNGQIQRQGMRQLSLSLRDLQEALRLHGDSPDPTKIELSYLERSGKVSVVPCKGEPRVVVVPVEAGVQTIRVEIG